MKLTTKLIYALAACLLTAGLGERANAAFDGDVRMWNELMVRQYKGERWQTYTWSELRWFNDIRDLDLWFFQQKVYYKVDPIWSVGGGPAWIEVQNARGEWNTLARMEFEINPTWRIGEQTTLQFRNRLETRWWETRDYETELVSRHRLRLSHKASWLPHMNRIEMSNEFFFDYRVGAYNENRLRVFDIHFDSIRGTTMNAFFQIRSRRGGDGDDWDHAYILGLGWRFDLSKYW